MRENLTVRYAGIQCFFWMGFATISGFASMFLLDAGFRNTQIGLIIALAGSISALLQPIAAAEAERGSRFGLKELICAAGGLILLIGLGLAGLKLTDGSRLLTGLLYGCCLLLLQLAMPLVNAAGTQAINQGKRLDFGAARGIGSIAYAAAAGALGLLAERVGTVAVPALIVLSFGLLLAALALFPLGRSPVSESKTGSGGGSPLAFLQKYPGFAALLTGTTLIYMGHMILNSYTFQIVQGKGGGSGEMGIATALSACCELPTMFLFTRMLRRANCGVWMRVSGVFFTLKALASWLAPNVPFFYGAQVFQMLGWGLITVALVYYINELMGQEDAIKGQACATMTYTIGSVLGALAGGGMLDWAGVNALLCCSFGVTLAGAAILFWAVGRIRRG